jgi:hypothetical protein
MGGGKASIHNQIFLSICNLEWGEKDTHMGTFSLLLWKEDGL